METSNEFIIWLAGFFDGEGWISLVDSASTGLKRPRLGIAQKNQMKLLESFKEAYGGYIQISTRNPGNAHWALETKEGVLRFLRDVFPYLRVKRQRAHIALAVAELLGREGQGGGLTDETRLLRFKLQEEFEKTPVHRNYVELASVVGSKGA